MNWVVLSLRTMLPVFVQGMAGFYRFLSCPLYVSLQKLKYKYDYVYILFVYVIYTASFKPKIAPRVGSHFLDERNLLQFESAWIQVSLKAQSSLQPLATRTSPFIAF